MSYTPSLASSKSKEAVVHNEHNVLSEPVTESSQRVDPTGPTHRTLPRQEVALEPTKGIWRYVPLQYLSLKPKITNPYITTLIASMGGLLFGAASTNLTPFIGTKAYEGYFGQFTPIDQSGMTAAMPGGATIGSIISMLIAENVGRRGMCQLGAIFWIIGCAIQTSAINRESLAFGRIIASIGVGTSSSNVPMYLAEMVPADKRGRFTSAFQVAMNSGMLIMFYVGFGTHFIHGVSGFRLAWGLQMVPGALMLFGTMFLYESPRWLASKGRWDETVQVLTALHHTDAESPIVKTELEQFYSDFEVKAGGFIDLFKKRNLRQTGLAAFTMLIQQYCGCNAIVYFSTSITSQVGYTGVMNSIMGSVDYIVLVAATFPSFILADKLPRRHVFFFGAIALLISLSVVAGIEGARGQSVGPEGLNGDPSVRWTVSDPPVAKAALAFSYIYLGLFSLSWGPTSWIYVSEIFNQDVRSAGNSFGSVVNWLFNFTLTIYTQSAFEHITWKTYVIFAVFCAISIPVVFVFYPETRGYELEQIASIFESNIPAYKTDPVYLWYMKLRGKEVSLPAPVSYDVDEKKGQEQAEHEENVVNLE